MFSCVGNGRGGGGVSLNNEESRDQDFWGRDHRGGAVFYLAAPLPPSAFQVLPAVQLGSNASGAREPGRAESGAASQALAGSRRRRVASEGSLPPTGRADLASKHIQRGGEGRVEHDHADTGGGGGSGIFARRKE